MNKELYKTYLLSPWWIDRRKTALRLAKNHCAICGSRKALQVHHSSYKRLGRELDSDLVVLCNDCHQLFHHILEYQLNNKDIK